MVVLALFSLCELLTSLRSISKVVSAAYSLTSDKRLHLGKSLMYNKNPSIEPSGIPHCMYNNLCSIR